jgi:hypothetical protein
MEAWGLVSKWQFLVKKDQIFFSCKFRNRIWIGIQPKMLDPDPESMNPDPKHWLATPHPI